MPTDPFEATPLVQPAAVTHELYESYLAAGFDRLAALYLVGIHVGTIGRFELERQAMAEERGSVAFPFRVPTPTARRRPGDARLSGTCPQHLMPFVQRNGELICLACSLGIPSVAGPTADPPIEVEGDPVPGAQCMACGGPVYDNGEALVCPHHPPPEAPQLGAM